MKANTNVVFAEIDFTANELAEISIQGYPTIFFFKKGLKNEPIKYEGDRSKKSLIEFIKQNTA